MEREEKLAATSEWDLKSKIEGYTEVEGLKAIGFPRWVY